MRRSKDPQRAHFADPLRAAFITNRDFSPHSINHTSFLQYVRYSKVPPQVPAFGPEHYGCNNQRQEPITNGLLPTLSTRSVY